MTTLQRVGDDGDAVQEAEERGNRIVLHYEVWPARGPSTLDFYVTLAELADWSEQIGRLAGCKNAGEVFVHYVDLDTLDAESRLAVIIFVTAACAAVPGAVPPGWFDDDNHK